MGLFRKKEPEKPAEPKKPATRDVYESVYVNLTDKMLQVQLVDTTNTYLEGCQLRMNGDMIQIVHRGILIATVGKKGKAHAELLPYIGERIDQISITLKNGDYGEYYLIRLKVYKETIIDGE